MVYLHLAEGFEEVEAVTVADILRRGGVDVRTVSMTGERAVTGAHGIPVTADLLFEEADYDACEMIVLPGGMPGTTNLDAHEGLRENIRAFASGGKKVAAVCAAPMVLAHAGVLEGRSATIYPGMEDELRGGGAAPGEGAVVKDGNIITSKAPGTAMVFALCLLGELAGAETAGEVEAGLHMA